MNPPRRKAAVAAVAVDALVAVAAVVPVAVLVAAARVNPQARPGVGASPAAVPANPAASAQRDPETSQTDAWRPLFRGGAACCSATRLHYGKGRNL